MYTDIVRKLYQRNREMGVLMTQYSILLDALENLRRKL